MKFLQLILEAREKRERIGGASGEARDDLVIIKTTRLLGVVLDHTLAERHLAVGGKNHLIVFPHAQHRGAVHRFTISLYGHPIIIHREARKRSIRAKGCYLSGSKVMAASH